MARKSEMKAAIAAIAPTLPRGHVQCACHAECKKPGRISPFKENLPGYGPKDRICVDHYYSLLETVRA